mmetsp:Transcript_37918/g.46199  ORF Transcript_37918/g.46199 Transcript_37918/m.46199 type:complete len:92 (+) Transcript_37918:186-461(+)
MPKIASTDVLDFKKPWDSSSKPISLMIRKVNKRATVKRQPTPVHDYINFKQMCGNEILINLNNVDNLGNYEMLAGLLELSKRDKKQKHDWN